MARLIYAMLGSGSVRNPAGLTSLSRRPSIPYMLAGKHGRHMVAEPIIIKSKHKIHVHPRPNGRCRLEIDATISWDTAIDVLKVLGYVGQLTTERIHADRT
jgi:hypothetical protein